MTDQDRIAAAAMESLKRRGVPIFQADMPGLYVEPTVPELTFNQLVGLACERDPSFDPARVLRSNSPPGSPGTRGRF